MSAVEQVVGKTDPVVVKLRGVAKQYQRGAEVVPVLEKLDLDLPRGDFVALMGPSGSGKTTLLNLIGGLDRPTTGSIDVDGVSHRQAVERRARPLARRQRRLRVPDVQPAARAHGGAQRRAAAAAHEARPLRAPEARAYGAVAGRARRPHEAQAARALGRPGAARRHRARHRHRSHAAAVRRADGRPRPQGRRRSAGPAAGAQQATRQDHRHGHARSARRRRAPIARCTSRRAASSGRSSKCPGSASSGRTCGGARCA